MNLPERIDERNYAEALAIVRSGGLREPDLSESAGFRLLYRDETGKAVAVMVAQPVWEIELRMLKEGDQTAAKFPARAIERLWRAMAGALALGGIRQYSAQVHERDAQFQALVERAGLKQVKNWRRYEHGEG